MGKLSTVFVSRLSVVLRSDEIEYCFVGKSSTVVMVGKIEYRSDVWPN